MSSQSSYENSLLSYTDTDRGISRTKFFEEGENCNIPALIGNPNCAGSWFGMILNLNFWHRRGPRHAIMMAYRCARSDKVFGPS